MNLAFFGMFFYLPKLIFFFWKIGNNYSMRALGIFGNAWPKSNARAHLTQRKNIVALESYKFNVIMLGLDSKRSLYIRSKLRY